MDRGNTIVAVSYGTEYGISQANIAKSPGFVESSAMNEPRPEIETREEVMFFDTDCGGVMHNISYLRMVETCRTRLAGLMGMDLRQMAGTQVFPVVTRTEIDYRKPARLGDTLVIRGRLEELSRARFWCSFAMFREGEDDALIKARQALALVRMPEGRPLRLPAEWMNRWADAKHSAPEG